ncbi:MAG: 5'/3'-nucleotidase SurE [Deltaproteobacteria bacterium]|nr:5'/3'-nucleotidase SurE [Deltaproteobacteria bacterium]
MNILLTNDDGIEAPGLSSLFEALRELGKTIVVAPKNEMSAVSRAITMVRPLRLDEVKEDWYAVDGTPVDCVYMALHHVLGKRPDMVISGINRGPNVGDDVSYSGTVAAAAEAALAGIGSFAVSLNDWKPKDYSVAAKFSASMANFLMMAGVPERIYFNVNVPAKPAHDPPRFVFTKQGKRRYPQDVDERLDPRGVRYFWIGGKDAGTWENIPGSDGDALDRGLISITPLKLDLTAHGLLSNMTSWALEDFEKGV